MSFGSGGFGGFGSNNNQSTSTFGGFGSTNNNTTTNNTSSGFGFGNNNNNTAGGFGSSPGGFGANNTSAFGSKPAFGATTSTGGGLFGNTNNNATGSSTFGGFGSNNNTTTNNTSSPFGGGTTTTGGSAFGNTANKTGFGASTTGGSLFGGNNTSTTTTSGFGGGGFGASNNPGIGAGGDPPGTAVSPFQAHTEKEPNSTSTNSFQNILFQDPYKKWSADELRLTDYVQGRRHGNASGAGAFGMNSGFGGGFGAANNNNTNQTSTGFGTTANTNTGGGLFGNNANNTTSAFGSSTSTFGNNNNTTTQGGGGLFGQNKPASGGLFGSTSTPQQSGGGLFGSSSGGFGSNNANTSTGFGATANNNTGGGLFGSNTQQKPAGTGFSFGNNNTTNTNTTGGFGSTTGNTGGGLFGNNTANNQQSTGGGLFGGNNNQQQSNTSGFGGGGGTGAFGQQNQTQNTGGGLFGNTQNKPAGGLFGSSTTNTASTGGGLFGNNQQQQQQQNTGGFGTNTQSTGGGLFGNKPAGGGLFGQNTTTQNTGTGGGLFGGLGQNNQNQQQSTGGGLFGQNNVANNQQPQKTGLFGASTPATGGGLFGNQNNQNAGSSIFGGSMNQQQSNGMQNSLLGNSQQQNNGPPSLTASLNDMTAYGAPSLFAGVGGAETPNPGPLATPIGNTNTRPRRSSVLPMYKLAPASGSRFSTPQKRGFGFSYSTYGTPGASPASSISSTPGGGSVLGRSLLGSSSTGSLSKSVSVNNLRRNFGAEDSILAPGAFSNSRGWYGSTGSRKLVINRDIRSDLFSTPQKDKAGDPNGSARKLAKRVSFDTSNVDADDTPIRGALPSSEDVAASTEQETTPRQNSNGGTVSNSDVEQSHSNENTPSRKSDSATPEATRSLAAKDKEPGEYWTRPSLEELKSLNRMQRTKVDGFTVGRVNVGQVEFKVPVDLSNINLDEIIGIIVQLEPRTATVYPDSAKKPQMGKGLNVPARISLEQSWSRNHRDRAISTDPKRVAKHIERLKSMKDTKFEGYDHSTGVWTFSVEHFTTYGFDDDEEDEDFEDSAQSLPGHKSMRDDMEEVDFHDDEESVADDTFAFRHSHGLPGAFDHQHNFREQTGIRPGESFLGVSSADLASNTVQLSLENQEEADVDRGYDTSDDEDMTRSLSGRHLAAEHEDDSFEQEEEEEAETKPVTPSGILRARMRALKETAGDVQLEVADGDDWAEMLRKSVSPMKRDRQQLRELNASPLATQAGGQLIDFAKSKGNNWKQSQAKLQSDADMGQGFATSIDLMNSLFDKPKAAQHLRASVAPNKGFPQYPLQRQSKELTVDQSEQAFHDAARPSWGRGETLLLPCQSSSTSWRNTSRGATDIVSHSQRHVLNDAQEIRALQFCPRLAKETITKQEGCTEIQVIEGVPSAKLQTKSLLDLQPASGAKDPASIQEKRVWELASILFDNPPADSVSGIDDENVWRKQQLSRFWADLVETATTTTVSMASSSEEKAVGSLAGHRIIEACKYLLDGKNFHLGTLVATIGTNDVAKKDMKEQLKSWHDSKTLSEFSEPIRTMYELVSGNVCVCEGAKGASVEDRMASFVISEKFGLDWKQSFGLRLWYAISRNDDLSEAVRKFGQDITQDKESTPQPWYLDQGVLPLWDDQHGDIRQDLLWGLLQLYTHSDADLEAILRPENSQLNPLDMRLSWQLSLALTRTGKVTFGHDKVEKMDACTLSFAAQLAGPELLTEAIFVLLHLTEPAARRRAIQERLCVDASSIDESVFNVLCQKLRIPEQWIWEARALLMRNSSRSSDEVDCLLRAGAYVEAHRVLVQHVAPLAIIERDYTKLAAVLPQFEEQHDSIAQWNIGGDIYSHFISLMDHKAKGKDVGPEVLEKLLVGLHAMSEEASSQNLVNFAAISDMADETAKEILKMTRRKQNATLRSRILGLPLTQDRLLAYSVDLSMDRYTEVMSH